MGSKPPAATYNLNIPATKAINIFNLGPLGVNLFGGGSLIIPQSGPPQIDVKSEGVIFTFTVHFDGPAPTTQSTTAPPPTSFNTSVIPPDPTPTPTDPDTPPPTEDTPPPTEDTPPPTEDTPEPTPFDSFDSQPFDSFDSHPFDSFDSQPFDSFDDSDFDAALQKAPSLAKLVLANTAPSSSTYTVTVPSQQIPGAPDGVYYAGTFTAQLSSVGQITISDWAVTLNCAWPGGGIALLPVPPQPS